MDSLYDLFDRKKEISILEERFEYEDQSVIMEDIIQESNMQFIQIQADSYVNELLIEESIYDEFNEQSITHLMESSFSEKKDKFIKFVQDKWTKIVAWFKRVVENIKNFFRRNKGSAKTENGESKPKEVTLNEIQDVLQKCETTVTIPKYRLYTEAMFEYGKLLGFTMKFYEHVDDDTTINDAKTKLLSSLGVHDRKGIKKVVHGSFIEDDGKPVETKIKDIDEQILIQYGLAENQLIDGIHQARTAIKKSHDHIMSELKSSQENKNIDKLMVLFNYATNLQGALTSAMIGCVKNIASNCIGIIHKALKSELGGEHFYIK